MDVSERRPQPFGRGGRSPELPVDDGDLDRADLGVDPLQDPSIDRVPDPVAVVVERERVGTDPVGA
ncbi:MAG TPA: hypothetical protein VFY08_04620 [Actinomycetota bacterium]|nr:hypothetical protein [Actinomycetota bacterium]